MERLDKDMYFIVDLPDGKYVHIQGYVYYSDQYEDGKDYRGVTFSGVYIPIEKFPDDHSELYDEGMDCCSQYICELTEDEAIDFLDNFYYENDVPVTAVELDYNEITPETPCGFYIQRYSK